MYQTALASKTATESTNLKSQKEFVARPFLPNIPTFIPEKSEKLLTKTDNFILATETRGEERKAFECENNLRMQAEELQMIELERRKKV
jgi:hypothetical protein